MITRCRRGPVLAEVLSDRIIGRHHKRIYVLTEHEFTITCDCCNEPTVIRFPWATALAGTAPVAVSV